MQAVLARQVAPGRRLPPTSGLRGERFLSAAGGLALAGAGRDARGPDSWLLPGQEKRVDGFYGVLTQWRGMTDFEPVTAADVQLMQGLAQRVTTQSARTW